MKKQVKKGLRMLTVGLLAAAAFMTTAVFTVSAEEDLMHTDSVLNGKTALFCGDSICAAAVHDKTTLPQTGWAGRIAHYYGMTVTNKGFDGASVSTCRGTNRIINQMKSVEGNTYDYVILHGGVNDAMDSAPVGVMSDSFDLVDFDNTTFGGALEELFYTAKQQFGEDTTIGYIVNFQTPLSGWGGKTRDMSEYFDLAVEICEKWEIPYLDLFHDEEFNSSVMKVKTRTYLQDYLHPNTKGYDVLYPVIAQWMEGLNATVDTTGTSADSTTSDQVGTTAAATDATTATSAVTTAVTTAGSGSPNTGFDNTVGIVAAAVILLLSVTAAVAVIRKRSGAR